ncbi:MAG: FHA domain-containing protein [Cellvibrionales bacterium]
MKSGVNIRDPLHGVGTMKDHFALMSLSTKEQVPLLSTEVVLGRSKDCEIVVPSDEASRQHARISILNGQPTLEDLGSTNGTLLNGRHLTSAQTLNGGDVIAIGPSQYQVIGPGGGGESTILSSRLGKTEGNFVVERSFDPEETGLRTPYPKAPGWGSDQDLATGTRESQLKLIDEQMAQQQVMPESTSAVLMVVNGEHRSALLTIASGKDTWMLGRDTNNDAAVDDITVSAAHATLIRTGDGWRVEDLDSTNGTKVNRKAVRTAPLVSGDVLSLGKVDLLFKAL